MQLSALNELKNYAVSHFVVTFSWHDNWLRITGRNVMPLLAN